MDIQTISFNLFKTSSLYELYKNRLAQMNDWPLATPIQNMREFTIARDW